MLSLELELVQGEQELLRKPASASEESKNYYLRWFRTVSPAVFASARVHENLTQKGAPLFLLDH